jgi:hypothetical protein
MKAGEIEINILANYQQIEKDLRHVEQKAQQAGDRAGKSFKEEFASKSQMQAESILGRFQGIKVAEGLARAMASFLRSDKSFAEALLESLKSVPFAGAFVDLGQAVFDYVYENTIGAAEAAARQQARLAEAAYAEQIAAFEQSAKEDVENEKRVAELRQTYAEEFRRGEIEFVEKRIDTAADLEEIFQRKRNDIIAKNERERTKALYETRSEEEASLTYNIYEKRKQIALEALDIEMRDRRSAMEQEQQQQLKAAEDLAAKKAKEEQEIADKLAEEAVKRLGELRDQQEEIEQKRADALTAGVTSANTALGTFTFDAYSDADKKRNDQDSLRQLREINRAMTNLGLT